MTTFCRRSFLQACLSASAGAIALSRSSTVVQATRLSEWHNQALRDAGVAKRITEQGGFMRPGSPEDFTKFIESEIAAWGEIVRTANVTP